MERVEVVVIGGGIVGLAIARAFSHAERSVLVIDKAEHLASETSARNSGVIHAGLYYPPGSVKAVTCVRGKQLLYAYCHARDIPYEQCGKIIVAQTKDECAKLDQLIANAKRCGVDDLVVLDQAQIAEHAPGLACMTACWSPSTGIVDPHAFASALEADCLENDVTITLNTEVTSLGHREEGVIVHTVDRSGAPFSLRADTVINAAGLFAASLTRTFDRAETRASAPQMYWGKGHYYTYNGSVPFVPLIYPLPSAGGLGVHLTRGVDGTVRFGPDITWVDQPDYHFNDTSDRRTAFTQAIQRYWPGLQPDKLAPDSTGIRPKLSPQGTPAADFVVHGQNDHHVPGYIALYGIESPGLTASLALAEHVRDLEQNNRMKR